MIPPSTLTIDRMKEVAGDPAFISCARAVFVAKAFAQCERERVDAYLQPLFELYTFTVGEKSGRRRNRTGERITERKDIWMAPDEQTDLWYAECDKEHRAHGYKGKPGTCPAACAESLLALAERNFVDYAKPLLMPELVDRHMTMDQEKKLLKILLGLAVKNAKPGELDMPGRPVPKQADDEPTPAARPRIRL